MTLFFNATFSLSNASAVADGRWYGGQPIWVTAQMQGLTAACYFWPGSEAEIEGVRPQYYMVFNNSIPYSARIDQVISWLSLASTAPSFISLYFSEVDTAGHSFGPDSINVSEAILDVDNTIGTLLERVSSLNINNINYLIVSDHGMTQITSQRVIFLDDYINLSDVYVVDWSPNTFLIPNNASQIYESLQEVNNLTVWYKQDIPTNYHLADNRRVTPIFALADLGWSIASHAEFNRTPWRFNGGNHGYDNNQTDMFGIFIGQGPAFKTSSDVSRIVNNIDLYVVMCQILGLTPSPNNGSLANLIDLLN